MTRDVNSGLMKAFPAWLPPGKVRSEGVMADATRVEPIANAVHLCIDMQSIFARGGLWETPWMERVLPLIVETTAQYTERTVFTRFITPLHPDDRPGRWRRYFRKWERATRAV